MNVTITIPAHQLHLLVEAAEELAADLRDGQPWRVADREQAKQLLRLLRRVEQQEVTPN